MTKKLSFKDLSFYRLMLFGLFFGAGNVILPVHLGQEAGAVPFGRISVSWLPVSVFPFLGVIAIGVSKSSGVYELAKRIIKHMRWFLPSCFT